MLWIGTSWKMNHDLTSTKKYIDVLLKNSKLLKSSKAQFFIVPPFTSLPLLKEYKKNSTVWFLCVYMHVCIFVYVHVVCVCLYFFALIFEESTE